MRSDTRLVRWPLVVIFKLSQKDGVRSASRTHVGGLWPVFNIDFRGQGPDTPNWTRNVDDFRLFPATDPQGSSKSTFFWFRWFWHRPSNNLMFSWSF